MTKRLDGRIAIVTGGASGIGREVSLRFAQEGASVLIADIQREQGEQVVAETQQAGGTARFMQVDVTDSAACKAGVEKAMSAYGRLDLLVNSAGIGAASPIVDLDEDLWDRVMDTNLKGVYLMTKFAFPAMAQNGGGVILNLASVAGMIATPGFAPYGVAKAAVIQLTKITALEGASLNIRANALCPVWVDTPMVQNYLNLHPHPDLARQEMAASIPLGRLGATADVAEAALYLASDEAAFLTGIALPIDGGATAGRIDVRRRPSRKQATE